MANNNKHTGPNVPALRFPEFSGEWERKSLGEFLIRIENGATYNTNDSNGFPMSRIETISSCRIDYNKVGYSASLNNPERYKLNKGDILLSHINSLAHIGKTAFYDGEQQLFHGMNLLRLSCAQDANPKCMYFFLNTPSFLNRCKVLAKQAVNQASISTSDLKNIQVYLPKLPEQSKISMMLSCIDSRIETQSKIIEEQETLLKSLRDKLLNQYSSFSTQCRLGDILCIGNGKDYQHLNEGDIPVYGTGGLMCYVNESLYDGESVCIGRKGTINKPIFLTGRFWTVDTLFYTHSYKGVLPRFCYHLFCTIDWLTYNEASGVPSLSKSTIEKIPILIPTIEMQGKIVQILDTIEEKLDTDRKTFQNYLNQKTYLLSRMFI